jgi:hypothetical protein
MQTLLQSVTIRYLTRTNQEHLSAVQHVTFWTHPPRGNLDPPQWKMTPTVEIIPDPHSGNNLGYSGNNS